MANSPSKHRTRSTDKSVVKAELKSGVLVADSTRVGQQQADNEVDAVFDDGSAFSVGERVTHKIFGSGVVLTIKENKFEIKFEAAGVKWILGSFLDHPR